MSDRTTLTSVKKCGTPADPALLTGTPYDKPGVAHLDIVQSLAFNPLGDLLASGGYPWTVVPVERRNDYMAALETASVGQDIGRFAHFLGQLVTASLEGKAVATVPDRKS